MDWLTTWTMWHWLGVGFLLLIAEVILPGVFFLWWGLAAIIVSAVMKFFPGLNLVNLVICYAVLSGFLSLIWWKYQHSKDNQDQSKTTLNQLDHAMLGKKGIVKEITVNDIGRGAFGDTTWRIQGENLNINDLIEVVDVRGITLIVKTIDR
ncbi:NfeD family protein [Rodentibacter caecimuris]|uniref:NfeD-like C-terminal domain-containing protein n=1 Tax=Rodentibacter caecimuris TaxID=1796644 RepID=A0ABX3KZM6_9PAST|nr:hypothetical protein BKG89_03425 [Rodentibacter heylii]